MTAPAIAPPAQDDVDFLPPPECLEEGWLVARWTGRDIAIDPGEEFLASLRERALIDFTAFQRLTRQGGLLFERKVEHFRRRWMAWTNHPGKFGATPAHNNPSSHPDVANIVWVSERQADNAGSFSFGQPLMRFGMDKWTITVNGLRQPIVEIDWDDAEGIARNVRMLGNTEYWRTLASLSFPDEWRNAMAKNEKVRRDAAEAKRQWQAEMAAARAFASVPPSTRRVARRLRQFSWRPTEHSVPVARDIVVSHCDMSDGSTLVRAAECLDISWSRNVTPADKRQAVARLCEHLGPDGYHALLARSGRIYIARDGDLLRTHLGPISRSRKETTLRVIP